MAKKKVKKAKEYKGEDEARQIQIEKTIEEQETEMEGGRRDEEVYKEAGREKLREDAEIEDWEEGFMEGAEGRGEQHCCAECGKNLGDEETEVFEREFDGEIKWFCSDVHAQKYADKLKRKKQRGVSPKESFAPK